MINTVELTSEQNLIVNLSPDAKCLVTAGPGTGKTHCLISRLEKLIDIDELSPAGEILILSFSRAAVYEVRKRVHLRDGNVNYVRPYTFDSFATRLLAQFREGGPWNEESFDGRIRAATELIKNDADVREFVASYRHILVDETQDLVADRSDFVKNLLSVGTGGFTLFGDPAQGIYSFQLNPEQRKRGAAELYDWLRNRFKGELREVTLTVNHRAYTDQAKIALWAGAKLNGAEPAYEQIRFDLNTNLLSCKQLNPIEAFYKSLKPTNGTVAILCRNNGQALTMSRFLHEKGIGHQLQRRASDFVVPDWIGKLFHGFVGTSVTKSKFEELVGEYLPSVETTADDLWAKLKLAEGSNLGGKRLDLTKIASLIRMRDLSEEFLGEQRSDFTVSTVHRAKGLEFDRVILLEPEELGDEDDVAEETRVLYVAMTRPKRELCNVLSPGRDKLYLYKNTDRWIRKYSSYKIASFEVKPSDTHSADPAGGFNHPDADAAQIQNYLANRINVGDPVRLELFKGDDWRSYYNIRHKETFVGTTCDTFSSQFVATVKPYPNWKVRWPRVIDDVFVEGVDTVAGTAAAAQRAGLENDTGIWLRVRVAGVGTLRF